jgi:hypothetical protein
MPKPSKKHARTKIANNDDIDLDELELIDIESLSFHSCVGHDEEWARDYEVENEFIIMLMFNFDNNIECFGSITVDLKTFERKNLIKWFNDNVDFHNQQVITKQQFMQLLDDKHIINFFEKNQHHFYQHYLDKLTSINVLFNDLIKRMQ